MAAILQHEQDAFSYTAAGMFVVVDHFLLLENGRGTSGILSPTSKSLYKRVLELKCQCKTWLSQEWVSGVWCSIMNVNNSPQVVVEKLLPF